MRQPLILIALVCLVSIASGTAAFAHAVTEGDRGYIMEISGVNLIPFIYLGAKHM
ncbi:MAG TPA: HupE/UreJ family protein, partial [Roseibacterium sp.]|nr:HupE/UreJ family protein [Roseibacterium sp.]